MFRSLIVRQRTRVMRFGIGPGDSRMTKQELCQKLDGLGELNTPEAQSDAHALAQTGVPIILPLSQIWAEGQGHKEAIPRRELWIHIRFTRSDSCYSRG